jgi:hypothetical protein
MRLPNGRVNLFTTTKQSPIYIIGVINNVIVSVNNLGFHVYPPLIFVIPPPPHLLGSPPPVSSLYMTSCQVSKGGSIPLAEYIL